MRTIDFTGFCDRPNSFNLNQFPISNAYQCEGKSAYVTFLFVCCKDVLKYMGNLADFSTTVVVEIRERLDMRQMFGGSDKLIVVRCVHQLTNLRRYIFPPIQ
jgi:hypothetical protein